MPWDSCHGEELFQEQISDAVIAAGPDFLCDSPGESGAEDATAFISQLEDFKQKRKKGWAHPRD